MHPSLLYHIAAARNDEQWVRAGRPSATRVTRPAHRWPRWLHRSPSPRTTTSTLSAER